jgi:hypothetical protein
MITFTIDFVGLFNAQEKTMASIATQTGLTRERVKQIAGLTPGREPQFYNRLKVGAMLQALHAGLYPPIQLEDTDEGPRLTIDWKPLLKANNADVIWLVRETKLKYFPIFHLINHDPALYNRKLLGAVLNALHVTLYPPFFLVNSDQPREPNDSRPRPATDYYRSRKE